MSDVRERLELELEKHVPEAPAGPVDDMPGRVIGVTPVDEQKADRSLFGRRQ